MGDLGGDLGRVGDVLKAMVLQDYIHDRPGTEKSAKNLIKPMDFSLFWSTGLAPTPAVAQGSAVDAGLV